MERGCGSMRRAILNQFISIEPECRSGSRKERDARIVTRCFRQECCKSCAPTGRFAVLGHGCFSDGIESFLCPKAPASIFSTMRCGAPGCRKREGFTVCGTLL